MSDFITKAIEVITDYYEREFGEGVVGSDYSNVGIAFTTIEEGCLGEHEIQVSANIIERTLTTFIDDIEVEKIYYSEDLFIKIFEETDFDNFVCVEDYMIDEYNKKSAVSY